MHRVALCQINVTVGDLPGNRARIARAAQEAADRGADLAVFPELAACGYPPEDLLLKPGFVDACGETVLDPPMDLPLAAVVGLPLRDAAGGALCNGAAVLAGAQVAARYRKVLLPNYGVFDEQRYFAAGDRGLVLDTGAARLGIAICEDVWALSGPVREEAAAGASTILCLSASPFHREKQAQREEVFARLCRAYGVTLLWCNLVGGQDELVFDGGSLAMDPGGRVLARAPSFEEALLCVDVPAKEAPETPSPSSEPQREVDVVRLPLAAVHREPLRAQVRDAPEELDAVYACLVLGVRDYVRKNEFADVVVGLSGGIDSALTAVVAVDALGAEHVRGVLLPSRYTSDRSLADTTALAQALEVRLVRISIEEAFESFLHALAPVFEDREPDETEENLQARIRAVYLMALSNKFRWLVLNTSNKSEAAVGYGTIYGDMIGAYGVLKDVFKTTVYALARLVNEHSGRERIPAAILERAPTAELKPGQRDQDALPAYEKLDPVLEAYIERDMSAREMIEAGFDAEVVRTAVRLTDRAEWKRRQSVPGVRVTPKAFGKDRRLPITNRYEG